MDHCKGCLMKGNLKECLETECNLHESWMVLAIKEVEQESRAELNVKLVEALLNLKRAEAERDKWKAEALGLRETVARVCRLMALYEEVICQRQA